MADGDFFLFLPGVGFTTIQGRFAVKTAHKVHTVFGIQALRMGEQSEKTDMNKMA